MCNTVELINNIKMPLVGLGTYPMKGLVLERALNACNQFGYKLYDSAWYYRNEDTIGSWISSLDAKREDLFIQSKLKAEQYLGRRRYLHFDKKSVKRCYDDTLNRYKLEYIDLYLMHSHIDWYMEAYKDMISLYEQGRVKAIGACNCTIEQLKRFKAMHGVYPMVNQVEMHPYYNRLDLVEFCKDNHIVVQAFSPFAHGDYLHELLHNETLLNLSKKYHKTISQIIIRWFVQRSISVIPQSSNPIHIKENIDVFDFELTDKEINCINKLDKNQSYGSFSKRNAKKFLGFTISH